MIKLILHLLTNTVFLFLYSVHAPKLAILNEFLCVFSNFVTFSLSKSHVLPLFTAFVSL